MSGLPSSAFASTTRPRKTVCVPPVTSSTTSHSMWASASASTGIPRVPSSTATPANLLSLWTANCWARFSWPSPSTLTANAPARETARDVGELLLRQASIMGGVSDRDVTELAVIPNSPSGVRVVTTVTPLGRCPTTWRNVPASNSGESAVIGAIAGTVLSSRRRDAYQYTDCQGGWGWRNVSDERPRDGRGRDPSPGSRSTSSPAGQLDGGRHCVRRLPGLDWWGPRTRSRRRAS